EAEVHAEPCRCIKIRPRRSLRLLQHLADIDPGAAQAESAARDWLACHGRSCTHRDRGRIPNFPDPDLQDWGTPATARTTVGCCASRPSTTQATSSASTSRFQVTPHELMPITGKSHRPASGGRSASMSSGQDAHSEYERDDEDAATTAAGTSAP